MGGSEFTEGKKLATDGNGLEDDWTMVLEMCAREIVSLEGFCQMPPHRQHYKLSGCKTMDDMSTGFCQMPPHRQHYKLSGCKTINSCMSRAPRYLRDYPKVTLLGGPLSHTLHRGNCVPELHGGSCQLLTHQRHYKHFTTTDFDPGDINSASDDDDETEAICDELARHYALHGLKDPEERPDSADEEVQAIMSQDRGGQSASSPRDVGSFKLNVFEQSQDSESIEVLSSREFSEDEEFLCYYVVDPDGKKRPIPAPRRLARMPVVTENRVNAANVVAQSTDSAVGNADPKTGKEVVFAEVRRLRSSLSDDSQGRDLSLIPPGFDGFSMLTKVSMPNTLPHRVTLPQHESSVLNTLPQYQSTEEAWHQAGPEFQQGQTRFRMYGNPFEAGIVLPDCIGPRPFVALTHNTTNFKPPDLCVDDNKIIPLRSVAFPMVGVPACKFGKTQAGLRLERELGPGLVAPPRRARLLAGSTENSEGKRSGLMTVTGSTEIEQGSTQQFPSTGMVEVSPPQRPTSFIGSTENGLAPPMIFPSKRSVGISPSPNSHLSTIYYF